MHVGLLPECVCVKVLDSLELKLQTVTSVAAAADTGNGAYLSSERATSDPNC